MSRDHLVLTAVGPDRPGLVKSLSAAIHDAGCNLEDSRMAILAGEFAIIVLLSGATDALAQVREAAAALEHELGFRITFKSTQPPSTTQQPSRYRLRVTGADQPGIVHRVSGVLAERQINVASLESRLTNAAFSGTPLFTLQAELQLPGAIAQRQIASDLEQVCDDLCLQLELEALPSE